MSFPDFDFGSVRPTEFTPLTVPTALRQISQRLCDLILRQETFLADLWTSLDNVIRLNECEVYAFEDPKDDGDPVWTQALTEGSNILLISSSMSLSGVDDAVTPSRSPVIQSIAPMQITTATTTMWCFNYFFINKSLKRIVLFSCVESMISRNVASGGVTTSTPSSSPVRASSSTGNRRRLFVDDIDDEDDVVAVDDENDEEAEEGDDLEMVDAPAGGIPFSTE